MTLKIDASAPLVMRTGEPLYDGSIDVPIGLAQYLVNLIDRLPAGDVGNTRKLGRVADRLDGAVGEIELSDEDVKALKEALDQPLNIPNWIRRNLEHHLEDEQNGVAEWRARYNAGAWRRGNEDQQQVA